MAAWMTDCRRLNDKSPPPPPAPSHPRSAATTQQFSPLYRFTPESAVLASLALLGVLVPLPESP